MVKTFRPPKKQRKPNKQHQASLPVLELDIQSLDHEGQGVVREHKPVVFVDGALPGERCRVALTEQKKNFSKGKVVEVLSAHPERQKPFCRHFGDCGGCLTQHIDHTSMMQLKQQAVAGLLQKLANIPDEGNGYWQTAISDKGTGYRRKARLAVDFRDDAHRKVGFRGKGSSNVVAIDECPVLQADLQALITPIRELCEQLDTKSAIGHIDLLQGDQKVNGQVQVTEPLVVFRVTRNLSEQDRQRLLNFAQQSGCQLVLEVRPGEYESLYGNRIDEGAYIQYSLPNDVQLQVGTSDFMQVNASVNWKMVETALLWLELEASDKVLDLFCGLGNFSLPVARHVAHVTGMEGVPEMVQRAKQNALRNGIQNVDFICKDLEQPETLHYWRNLDINKVILDPSRPGAKEMMSRIVELSPEKVLYVSCNPATFGRDIAELVGVAGQGKYRLDKIALLDMFPYTAHTELISLFVRQG